MKITCSCQHYVNTDDTSYNITKYENKPVLKRHSNNGEYIVKEVFYYYVCPRCDKEVVEIHRFKRNAIGNLARVEREQLFGLKAANYLIQTQETRKQRLIEFKEHIHSKGIPLRYGKCINDETVRLRYINECGFDGDKIESKVKIYS